MGGQARRLLSVQLLERAGRERGSIPAQGRPSDRQSPSQRSWNDKNDTDLLGVLEDVGCRVISDDTPRGGADGPPDGGESLVKRL